MRRAEQSYQTAESAYLLAYEKQKLITCADSFQSLAKAFMMPREEQEENKDRQNLLWRRRLQENQMLLGDNLREMAGIMRRLAEDSVQIIRLGSRKEKELLRSLYEEGVVAKDLYLIRENDGRMLLSVSLRTRKDVTVVTEDVGDFLAVLLNMHLVPVQGSPFFLGREFVNVNFEEEAAYVVLTGAAKAVKETETVSGDNYSFLEAGGGNSTMILSDGMGSGEKACGDSETVVDMLERFLEAGIGKEMAVQMINGALLAAGEEQNLSTLDLCSLNLYTGEAEFVKIGAASTYLKRGRQVERIVSVTLPLGVFHEVEVKPMRRQLSDGDFVIMISDGVLAGEEPEKREQLLKEMIGQIEFNMPQEIANFILQYAIGQNVGKVPDDMTVLVAGIWENTYED